jgi:hypothetical protein
MPSRSKPDPLVFLLPNVMSTRGYGPRQIDTRIKALSEFIGKDRLTSTLKNFDAAKQVGSGVGVYRLLERQPLIEGFAAYRRAKFGRPGPLKSVDPDLHELANIAGNYWVVAPTLTPDLAAHQREKMLNFDGQLAPQFLEWTTVASVSRLPQCEIAWFPVHETGPEFAVRAAGLEWEMECKRLSPMVVELLGDAEADRFAEQIMRFVERAGWQGTISVTVPADAPNQAVAIDVPAALSGLDLSVPVDAILPGEIRLRARLHPRTGQPQPADAWQQAAAASKQHDARLYAMGPAQGAQIVDPIVLQLASPQRTAGQLLDHLWERKFRKAASQCTGKRAAALVFEWQGMDDAGIFSSSPMMQNLMARIFDEFRHVAFIIMRCVQPPTMMHGSVHFSSAAYFAQSKVTRYPEVARLLQTALGRG